MKLKFLVNYSDIYKNMVQNEWNTFRFTLHKKTAKIRQKDAKMLLPD